MFEPLKNRKKLSPAAERISREQLSFARFIFARTGVFPAPADLLALAHN